MKKFAFMVGLFLTWAGIAAAQTFEARVNRSEVPEGETFLLSVELEGAKTNNTPDFGVLNADFTVYSVSNAYRTNIINGQVSQSQQWNLVLMPNKTGTLTIPAISLDQYKTAPLTINVGAVQQTSGGQGQNSGTNENRRNQPRFKIEAEVDNRSPYVQQQINYTLTLYDTGGLQGEEPLFQAADENDWIIKSLGAPEIDTKTIDGRNLREIKFRYAMFPQKSGVQEIPAVRFNGYYLTRDRRSDPFGQLFNDDLFIAGFGMTDVFATKNPVVLTAKPIKINVLPAPAENAGNWWLPAENVSLHAEFNPPRPQFKVGEAVNRTIYLQAAGVIDSQLPDLKFKSVKGLKQYPEKPQVEMRVEQGKIIALEKIANVYIPSRPGDITLPEIAVSWFNVNTKTMEKAVLPAMTVKVVGEAETAAQPPAADGRTGMQTGQTAGMPDQSGIKTEESLSAEQETNLYLLLGGAFILGILLCLALIRLWGWFLAAGGRNYKKQVIKAAKARDLRAVRDNLLAWAAERYPGQQILSLQDIDRAAGDKEFRCELDKLGEALYAKDMHNWNEFLFIRVFNKINKRKKGRRNNNEPLPKLYK